MFLDWLREMSEGVFPSATERFSDSLSGLESLSTWWEEFSALFDGLLGRG